MLVLVNVLGKGALKGIALFFSVRSLFVSVWHDDLSMGNSKVKHEDSFMNVRQTTVRVQVHLRHYRRMFSRGMQRSVGGGRGKCAAGCF